MALLNANLISRFPELDAERVREIIDTDLEDYRIHNFINLGWFVTRPLAGNLGACGGADAEAAIIVLLAAHFLSMYEREVKGTSIGDYSVSYSDIVGPGLKASRYGRQAEVLDCTGRLSTTGLKRAQFTITTYYDITPETAAGFDADVITLP